MGSCSGSVTFNTAHLQNRNYTNQVEVGVEEYLSNGNKVWRMFTEVQIGNTIHSYLWDTIGQGQWLEFKVKNTTRQSGNTNFDFWWSHPLDTWTQVGNPLDGQFTYGIPMGEVSKKGTSSALDHQKEVKYQHSDGTWSYWENNSVTNGLVTGISGYHYCHTSHTEWYIRSTSTSC